MEKLKHCGRELIADGEYLNPIDLQRLKIRFFIRKFWPLKGGLTLHALRLGQELLLRGHDFEVITPFTTQRPDGDNIFWAKETRRSFLNEGVQTHVVGLSLIERLFLLPLKKLQCCEGKGVFFWHDVNDLHPDVVKFVNEWRKLGRDIRRVRDRDLVYWKSL